MGSSAGEARGLPLLGRNPPMKWPRAGEFVAEREEELRLMGDSSASKAKKIAQLPFPKGKIHQVIDDPYRWRG
jgi:hypothetical protein